MVFVIDNLGSVPFAAVGGIRLSDQHHDTYQLVGMMTEQRGSTVEFGYVLRDHQPNGRDSGDNTKAGVIPRSTPALVVRAMILELPSLGKSLKSQGIRYWANIVRRMDLTMNVSKPEISTRLASGNPWCTELPPMEVAEAHFDYHYDGDAFVTEGFRYRETWAFGASVLWCELPALLLVAGRGTEPSDLWFEPVSPEGIARLQRLPRLILD